MGTSVRWKGMPWIAAMAAALLLAVVLFHLAGAESAPAGEASTAASSNARPRSASALSRSIAAPGARSAEGERDPISMVEPDGVDGPAYPVDLDRLRERL